MRIFAPGSICLLLAAASVGLLACGSVVIIDGEAAGTSTPGAGGSGGEGSGVTSSSSTTSGGTVDPPPSDECPTICAPGGDQSHCACKRFCNDPSFSKPNAKISCAPIDDGAVIQCVCTYGEDFSGVCFEKNNQACNFDLGCCAKYFYGK